MRRLVFAMTYMHTKFVYLASPVSEIEQAPKNLQSHVSLTKPLLGTVCSTIVTYYPPRLWLTDVSNLKSLASMVTKVGKVIQNLHNRVVSDSYGSFKVSDNGTVGQIAYDVLLASRSKRLGTICLHDICVIYTLWPNKKRHGLIF